MQIFFASRFVTRLVPDVAANPNAHASPSALIHKPHLIINMPVALSSYYKPTSSKAPTESVGSIKRTSFSFDRMEEALASFAAGEFLVVTDDENRENEGDLIISASQCTTEKMAWLIKHSRLGSFSL
jgi:hypothetical protein